MCSYYSMRLQEASELLVTNVWQSIFYNEFENKYQYCVNGTKPQLPDQCYDDKASYAKWDIARSDNKNCGSVHLDTYSQMSFNNDYNWVHEDCSKNSNHFMCRVDCDKLPTPEPPTQASTTTVKTTTTTPLPPWERQISITVNNGDFGQWQDSQKNVSVQRLRLWSHNSLSITKTRTRRRYCIEWFDFRMLSLGGRRRSFSRNSCCIEWV